MPEADAVEYERDRPRCELVTPATVERAGAPGGGPTGVLIGRRSPVPGLYRLALRVAADPHHVLRTGRKALERLERVRASDDVASDDDRVDGWAAVELG